MGTRRIAAAALALVAALSLGASCADRVYTLDADFDEGVLLNVNHDAPNNDQLQLNAEAAPFPFINVAASARGTMVRVNTDSGEVLGEYRAAPEGRGLNPSRTTVDLFGNVWTGNRDEEGSIGAIAHGSVVKIGLIVGGTRANADGSPNPLGAYRAPPFAYNTCVDRDADGLVKTSAGLGDIRPWPDVTDGAGGADGVVEDADDECILIYQRLPDAPNVRHVSIDANNDVWVGGYPFAQRSFLKLDGSTGAILDDFDARQLGCGGYGGLVDGNGVLWSASISQSRLLRYDPVTRAGSCIPVANSYGLWIDTLGFLWNSMWTSNSIVKVSPVGVVQVGFPRPTGGAGSDRGVTVTPADNHVWVANSGGSDVSRLDNAGNLLKVVPVGATPTGVAVDAEGKVWVTNLGSDNIMRIDPDAGADGLGAVDLTVSLGSGAGPYNYSDMTGAVAIGATAPQGTWSVVHDGEQPGQVWARIVWNTEPEASEPPGSSITVEARAADSEAGLPSEPFVPVANGATLGLVGRFIEIQATLRPTGPGGVSPVLSDLRVDGVPERCDVDGDFEVDRDDVLAIVAARGTTALPDDPRDANLDGLISINDARLCVYVCDRPLCGL